MEASSRNDVEWARSNIRLSPPPTLVYCPYHSRWEPLIEDDSLCEWCCQKKPCVVHGDDDEVMVLIVVDE